MLTAAHAKQKWRPEAAIFRLLSKNQRGVVRCGAGDVRGIGRVAGVLMRGLDGAAVRVGGALVAGKLLGGGATRTAVLVAELRSS